MQKPLKDIVVLEFSQYLSGPVAGLRLADLGARVIKIERPDGGDACRKLVIKNLWLEDNSLLFHTINRNKESFTVDLKDIEGLNLVKELIKTADVLTHNFRPGTMDKIGLNFEQVHVLNPAIIYLEISGYGNKGPWRSKPGQDLLIQAMSGLTFSTGNKNNNPMPFGLSIADYLCGNQAVQGVLAALLRRQKTNKGALIQLSLLESIIDFQFEFFTTYFLSNQQHQRSEINNGHALLSAPYGIYQTADGYIAVAMMPIEKIAAVIGCSALSAYRSNNAFEKRDEIKSKLIVHFLTAGSQYWLEKMEAADLWVMPVLDWHQLQQTEAFQQLRLSQRIKVGRIHQIATTRCPIRINGEQLLSDRPAPVLSANTAQIIEELKQKA